jgi:protein ImuA
MAITNTDHSSPPPSDRLARLRARVYAIEGGDRLAGGSVPLGVPAVDAQLPGGGIRTGALHEITAGDAATGAATAFAAVLLGRLMQRREGAVLWCLHRHAVDTGEIHGPGLTRFGIDPARLIAVQARRDADVLWAVEEGLRCPGLVAVLGETVKTTLTATRRLQIAAEDGGVTALLLRPARSSPAPSAAVTGWRVSAAPGLPRGFAAALGEPGAERWHTELIRCRRGRPGAWLVEWCDETGDLALAAPVCDRPARPRTVATFAQARRAGA